jgi:hypothetical protein
MTSPPFHREWNEDERGHIKRLEQSCAGRTHWVLACGHTEAGDPWCALYDRWRRRVILRITRIGLHYVVASPQVRTATKPTMAAAVELALVRLSAHELPSE